PAAVSNCQAPLVLMSGIGNGHDSSPTSSTMVVGASATSRLVALKLSANSCNSHALCTTSGLVSVSISGPNKAASEARFVELTASPSAFTAASAVGNVLILV